MFSMPSGGVNAGYFASPTAPVMTNTGFGSVYTPSGLPPMQHPGFPQFPVQMPAMRANTMSYQPVSNGMVYPGFPQANGYAYGVPMAQLPQYGVPVGVPMAAGVGTLYQGEPLDVRQREMIDRWRLSVGP